MFAVRIVAAAAIALAIWTSLRLVRNEANPLLRRLASRVCYRDDGSAYWCTWARVMWWGYWVFWTLVVAFAWWPVAAAIGVVEIVVVCWNVYWSCRRSRERAGRE